MLVEENAQKAMGMPPISANEQVNERMNELEAWVVGVQQDLIDQTNQF